jgi:hypothetical protein
MKLLPIVFYKRNADFIKFHHQIKHVSCPHCHKTGYLILHGFLHGYDEKSSHHRIIRGHRIFCSNRNRRHGCGRTFSVLTAHILQNFIITTQGLWDFLNNILKGHNKLAAFGLLQLPFCATSVYRLYQRFYLHQSQLRSLLIRKSPPPVNVPSRNPLIKTILHFKFAFTYHSNPLSAFQAYFQTSLL